MMEVCEICNSKNFKYCCPRCNIKYCSLDCYRSEVHGQCSEAFYKECVMKELQLQNEEQGAARGDKHNVLSMLQRLEEDNNIEEDDELLDSDDESENPDIDLAKRLDEVDLNDADAVWERLTTAEKEEFKSMIYNNEIEKIVQVVEPWWMNHKIAKQSVIDIEENQRALENIMEMCPKISTDIKDFSKISSKSPAPCIIYNIANVIGSYAFIFRFYNGDQYEYAPEAIDNFISISDNIKASANFDNIASVVDSIIHNCQNHRLFADADTKRLILTDLKTIFDGPREESNYFLLSAMSDTISLFESAKLEIKNDLKKSRNKSKSFSSAFPDNQDQGGVKQYKELQNSTHFNNCLRKLQFYLSFLKHFYNSRDWIVEF